MKKLFIRLPLEGKLSPKVTDEVENLNNDKHLIRQTSSATFPSRGRLNRKGSRSRRGFTLVEVVVALVIIVLVSGISIGVVTVNNKAHAETIDMIEATNIAENAVECFRFAVRNGGEDVKGTFEKHFAKSMGVNLEFDEDTGDVTNYPFELEENGSYIVTDGRVVVTISLSDLEDDADLILDSITITATNGGTNALIETKTYTVR